MANRFASEASLIRSQKTLGQPILLERAVNTLEGAKDWITMVKAKQSAEAMDRLSAQNRWPRDPKRVFGYLGRTGSGRQFKDIGQLFNYTKKNNNYYNRSYRFEPSDVANMEIVKKAADFVFTTARRESYKHRLTGILQQSLTYMVKQNWGDTPKMFFGDVQLNRKSELIIAEIAEYASSVEAHSVERARTGGILYMAAQMATKRFPQVIIRYGNTNLDKLGLPLLHKYAVPYVRVALRGGNVKANLSRPGRNIRRRGTAYRRMGPHSRGFSEYHQRMRTSRREAGWKRQDSRHWGDDLFSYYSQRRRKLRK